MLSPSYLESLPVGVVNQYAELESYIIADIARRIAGADYMMTPTAEWQIKKAQELRMSYDEIQTQVARQLGKTKKEVKEIFKEAGIKALSTDASIHALAGKDCAEFLNHLATNRVFQEGIKQTNGLMANFCKSLASTSNKTFERVLDQAYLEVQSGAFSQSSVIRKAIKDLASQGLGTITYPSGYKCSVEAAVRRAVITGTNLTAARLQLDLAREVECDLVEVTSHFGARPSHQEWQGGIYSISGKHSKYQGLEEVTGYGTGEGLCGYNCRHNFYPYYEGISQPLDSRYDAKESNEYYEMTQKQRALERKVRKRKRQVASMKAALDATNDDDLKKMLRDDLNNYKAKLKKSQSKLENYCKDNGLYRRKDREVGGRVSSNMKTTIIDQAKRRHMDKELNKLQALKGPRRNRHYISSINGKTPVKPTNTIIHPSINVDKDIEDIKKGLYTRLNEEYTVNGRTYKFHGNRFYPVRGNGFLTLTPKEYQIIKTMSMNKGRPSLEKALKGIKASDEDVARLTKLFEEWW